MVWLDARKKSTLDPLLLNVWQYIHYPACITSKFLRMSHPLPPHGKAELTKSLETTHKRSRVAMELSSGGSHRRDVSSEKEKSQCQHLDGVKPKK